MFGYLSGNTVAFLATHPLLCRAFVNFAARLEKQYDFDKLTLKEKLKQYI